MAQIEVGLRESVKRGAVSSKDRLLPGGDQRHDGRSRRPIQRFAWDGRLRYSQEIQQPREALLGMVVREGGDAANLTRPLGGYTVVDLNVAFRPSERTLLFAVVDNALDKRYDTYGSFGPVGSVPWPNVPGGVNDPRTASPGAPIVIYGGARVTF